MADQMKTCGECGQEKSLLDFPIRSSSPDGHNSWCTECKRAKDREYGATYRGRHPERKRRNARRHARKPETRAARSAAALVVKYGLTPEAFAAKLAAQGGRCPFCPADAGPPALWDIDHDHSCCAGQQTCGGCLRDILCHKHNAALGLWDDDPELMRAAADYVEHHRARIRAAGTTPWEPKGVAAGERHYAWKGDDATRNALRQRVYRARGTASHCVNGCTAKAFEWSCPEGADPADIEGYVAMCIRCVRRSTAGSGHPNAKLTADQVAEIRSRYIRGRKPTQWDLAREYGVGQAVISLIVRGERYVA